MTKYTDLAALNDVKAYIMTLTGDRLEHEAWMTYGLQLRDYDSEQELRAAMLAVEERNYWK